MLIVADSSALIALAICDGVSLLDQLFGEIRVPQAVFDEVTIEGKPAAATLRGYLADKVTASDMADFVIAAVGLGEGELEAMALYKRLHADYLLIDDRRARKIARLNQTKITGSQGVLLLAKHEGVVERVAPFLERLRASDIRVSEKLINRTLGLAEEGVE